MVRQQELHPAQVSILDTLRHAPAASFSALMKPTGLTSDTFKFHVRSLQQNNYICKRDDGMYQLTTRGNEYANNLDRARQTVQKQPKLSVLIFVSRQTDNGTLEYVFQKRQRRPYFDFWSVVGGPVHWGEEIQAAAGRELLKQTGLQADVEIKSFYRKRDYDKDSQQLLEDKLFALTVTHNPSGELTENWRGGHNRWMTMEEFTAQQFIFDETLKMIEMIQSGKTYHSSQAFYSQQQY